MGDFMKALSLVALTALTLTAASAAEKDVGSANFMLPYWRLTPGNDTPEPFMSRQCRQTVEVARNLLNMQKIVNERRSAAVQRMLCADFPEGVRPEQIMGVVLRYGDMHPEETRRSFMSFVVLALSAAWPCEEWRPFFPPEIIREQ
jgi:hypothetical protein